MKMSIDNDGKIKVQGSRTLETDKELESLRGSLNQNRCQRAQKNVNKKVSKQNQNLRALSILYIKKDFKKDSFEMRYQNQKK